jgi:ABC-type nitrate/sulfonate/bicarbonate transport system substrate-binding protein
MLFMQAEEGLTASLVGRPGVNSITDLRGKLLAGDPGDSNLDLIRKKILRAHGMDDTEYKIEIIGSSPKRYEAFMERRVVAAMLTPPWSDKALASGAVLLADAAAYVPNWPLTCGWTLRKWLEGHRELVVRFIRAWAAATDWLAQPTNKEECLQLVMEKEGMNRASAERAYAKVVPKARINPAALKTVIELRKEMGVYQPPFEPPERFYDASYWCEGTGLAG